MSEVSVTASGVDYVQPQQKKQGGGGKAVASTFIPGLGQLCDGRTKTGLAYLGGVLGSTIAGRMLVLSAEADVFSKTTNTIATGANVVKVGGGTKAKLAGALALGLTATGLWIASIVDAYKGGKVKQQ